jgi:hypothetical protein
MSMMSWMPVWDVPSNSHCSQFVLLIAGVILTELMGSEGDVENVLTPSRTSKAVLLLVVHASSSHFGLKSWSVVTCEKLRGTWYRFAEAREDTTAAAAKVLNIILVNILVTSE